MYLKLNLPERELQLCSALWERCFSRPVFSGHFREAPHSSVAPGCLLFPPVSHVEKLRRAGFWVRIFQAALLCSTYPSCLCRKGEMTYLSLSCDSLVPAIIQRSLFSGYLWRLCVSLSHGSLYLRPLLWFLFQKKSACGIETALPFPRWAPSS